ncbi:mitochondrial substrate carrier family protein [Hibiscus syriacus]|uniref:Mitochondrial substrate carrier family protein n=1 Tax=Hibiscus syriacus TaxID=106335 RepID=A0A6A2ZNJ4_HIBSY|nr:mitochondrial substrate carrier family protein [Hibiscus syriacus]
MRKSFKDSLKALEADIQFANTLASDYPREYDGACLQMRLSYSPAAHFFLFFVQWTDCHLAGALGLLRILMVITDVDERKQKEICVLKFKKRDEMNKGKLSEIDFEREEECGICMEMHSKIVLPNCNHSMCMKCYRTWGIKSQLCPFCRDSLKRVDSGDLWIYTSTNDIADLCSISRENMKRLFMYIEKLPLIVSDPKMVYDPQHQRLSFIICIRSVNNCR